MCHQFYEFYQFRIIVKTHSFVKNESLEINYIVAWTDKYSPISRSTIIGNNQIKKKFYFWLNEWQLSLKENQKATNSDVYYSGKITLYSRIPSKFTELLVRIIKGYDLL